MSDAIKNYETAVAEILKCTAKARDVAAVVEQGARLLQDWKTTLIVGVPEIEFMPDASTVVPTLTISASTWPTAADIGKALSDWHLAKMRLVAAYEKIPKVYRRTTQPPRAYL